VPEKQLTRAEILLRSPLRQSTEIVSFVVAERVRLILWLGELKVHVPPSSLIFWIVPSAVERRESVMHHDIANYVSLDFVPAVSKHVNSVYLLLTCLTLLDWKSAFQA
jgi:hypothetical protein